MRCIVIATLIIMIVTIIARIKGNFIRDRPCQYCKCCYQEGPRHLMYFSSVLVYESQGKKLTLQKYGVTL